MSKTLDFINNERATIGKTYTEITYAISEVEKFIVKCNPSSENPVVITKRAIGDTEKTLSIAQILSTYEMETEDKYINIIFDVLKVHFEDEPQLDISVQEDSIVIFVKKEEVIEEVVEEVVEEESTEEVVEEKPVEVSNDEENEDLE